MAFVHDVVLAIDGVLPPRPVSNLIEPGLYRWFL